MAVNGLRRSFPAVRGIHDLHTGKADPTGESSVATQRNVLGGIAFEDNIIRPFGGLGRRQCGRPGNNEIASLPVVVAEIRTGVIDTAGAAGRPADVNFSQTTVNTCSGIHIHVIPRVGDAFDGDLRAGADGALLQSQVGPVESPRGPITRPYSVTGHCSNADRGSFDGFTVVVGQLVQRPSVAVSIGIAAVDGKVVPVLLRYHAGLIRFGQGRG